MDLDDFADYRVSIAGKGVLNIRHHGCPDDFVEAVILERPFAETNLKWLMLRATTHWQEVHNNGE